jgi:hypothetical protein
MSEPKKSEPKKPEAKKPEPKKPEPKKTKPASDVKMLLSGVAALTPETREEFIDAIMQTYCTVCAVKLDAQGDCPDGCDPAEIGDGDEG